MEMNTKRLAMLVGVSQRTLHYYDEIGLLKPHSVDEQSGYRTYNEESFFRMQHILFYRELGFSLECIRDVIDADEVQRSAVLRERKQELLAEKERIERLVGLLEDVEQGQSIERIINSFDKNTALLDERATTFYELLDEADKLLEHDTVHGQLVLVKTAKGNIYHMFNNTPDKYDPMKDIAFMDMLLEKDDAQVRFITVLWNPHMCELSDPDIPYALEVPPWCLSRGLLDLAPGNEDALVYLRGEGFYNSRTLAGIQPLQTQEQKDREWKRICALRSAGGK